MAIKRYTANADTTISDAYKEGFFDSASLSNMGAADSLEIFYIAQQVTTSSAERSRVLIQFPVTSISDDRSTGGIPTSGNVEFYLRMYHAPTPFTLPRSYTLEISPVSASWDEGRGLDMDEYSDTGEANWIYRESGTLWASEGGDYLDSPRFTSFFDVGDEDLEVNITPLVESWVAGTIANYGVGVALTSSLETGTSSYYTKKFYARGSEYFFNRPVIEARWDSSQKDNRGNFYASSTLASGDDNLHDLYLYNHVRGQLKDIPSVGTGSVYVTLHTSASGGDAIAAAPDDPVTASWVSSGTYRATFALDTSASIVYDRWFVGSDYFYTGSFTVNPVNASVHNPNPKYYTSMPNLKEVYSRSETNARLRVFTRDRNWCPTAYTVSQVTNTPQIVDDAYYRVIRLADGLEVVKFGTGSMQQTRLSYDASGSYFDFDMSLLEGDMGYAFQMAYYVNGRYEVQPDFFRFRVRE